jgi:DNA-binding transcriptional ArsR family regulator
MKKSASFAPSCCQEPDTLHERSLLSPILAGQLGGLFKVLSNDTRLRLLHELIRTQEACVSDISQALGMSQQAISNQLQRLVDWRIVGSRREGNNIHYRLVNPCVRDLLARALCCVETDKWSQLLLEREGSKNVREP